MGWGGRAGRALQLPVGKTAASKGTWWTQRAACKGPHGDRPPQREDTQPSPGAQPSHGQLAGDGEGVAPLQGPVLPPLSACDGPGRLLRGDPVPGGVRRTRSALSPGWHTPRDGRLSLEGSEHRASHPAALRWPEKEFESPASQLVSCLALVLPKFSSVPLPTPCVPYRTAAAGLPPHLLLRCAWCLARVSFSSTSLF